MSILFERKNIFDLLSEAEDDNTNSGGASTRDSDSTSTDASSDTSTSDTESQSSSDNNTEEPASEEPEQGDNNNEEEEQDFSIDASMDDSGTDDSTNDSSSGTTDTSTSSSTSSETSEDEPVEANTDIFSSLSKEEQQIKIRELKKNFLDLYSSCDDISTRINDIEVSDTNIDVLSRISEVLYDVKLYISDYIQFSFAHKSYYENDTYFNRFLSIFISIKKVFEDLIKEKEAKK